MMRKVLIITAAIVLIACIKFLAVPTKKITIVKKRYEVTAHRGYSEYYPENTMEAFIEANNAGADWIELDVQETKDGVVVVTHNANFKNTANVNKYVYNMTYKEVSKLNVGYYMKKEAKVPRLEDVLIWAKENKVRLNIEFKDNGHIKNLIKSTVDLINKYSYREMVIVTSQNYDFLKQVKEYDGNMKTAYVGRKLGKEIEEYVYADIFSIKKTELTPEIVREMHSYNKQVYVWTIIDVEEVKMMCEYDVDNMIANDIKLVKDALKNC